MFQVPVWFAIGCVLLILAILEMFAYVLTLILHNTIGHWGGSIALVAQPPVVSAITLDTALSARQARRRLYLESASAIAGTIPPGILHRLTIANLVKLPAWRVKV